MMLKSSFAMRYRVRNAPDQGFEISGIGTLSPLYYSPVKRHGFALTE